MLSVISIDGCVVTMKHNNKLLDVMSGRTTKSWKRLRLLLPMLLLFLLLVAAPSRYWMCHGAIDVAISTATC